MDNSATTSIAIALVGLVVALCAVPMTAAAQTIEEIEPAASAVVADDAIDAVTRQYIWAEDLEGTTWRNEAIDDRTRFYRGRHKEPLKGAELYRTLDRPDLAARYTRRNIGRISLIAGGVALQTAPLAYLLFATESADRNISRRPGVFWGATIGTMIAGMTTSLYAGLAMDPHPLEPHEARRLAERHNRSLFHEYDVDKAELPAERESPSIENLRVSPSWDPDTDTHGVSVGFDF